MDASDWDDKIILERTKLESEGSLGRLSIDLGNNIAFTSELAQPDELRKHMIQWCDAVRTEIKNRAAAARPRVAQPVAAPPTAAQVAGLQTPVSALAHARKQLEIAVDMLATFSRQREDLHTRISEVESNIKVWSAVIDAFRVVVVVEDPDDLQD